MKIYHVSQNLLDITDSNHGMYINDEGEMVYNPAWDTSNYIEVSGITGLTYSLISNNNGIRDLSINEYSSDYTFIGVQSSGTIQRGYNSFSATLDSNTKYVRVSWINSEEASPDTEIMLNKGLTAEEYEPYGNTWEDATVKKSRKSYNLFNSTTAIEGNGIRAASPTSTYPLGVQYEVAGSNCSPYVAVSPNTTYTITYPAFLGSSRTGLVYYSDNTVESAISGVPSTQQAETYTFTTPADCRYIRFTWKNTSGNDVMLNEGATELPYEPYGVIWVETTYKRYETKSETIQSGDTIYANGQPISSYTIKGNTVQSGTPTPSNPVSVNGVGEETANLYNYQTVAIGKYIDANGVEQTSSSTGHQILNHTAAISISAGSTYTFKIQKEVGYSSLSNAFCWFDNSNQFIYRDVRGEIASGEEYIEMSYTAPSNAAYLIINFRDNYYDTGMLNTGSTAKPYEPWGLKIPILTTQGSANIYLSEPLYKIGDYADTINSDGTITRRIGKVVLDGTENQWGLYETDAFPPQRPYALYQIYTSNSLSLGGETYSSCYSDIAPYGLNSDTRQEGELGVYLVTSGNEIAFQLEAAKNSFPDVAAWRTYLSQNPVTVYYILATPTIESITAPSIPTIEGANSITVDTTVQPSEFLATWTGWHDSSVKEWDGTNWQ